MGKGGKTYNVTELKMDEIIQKASKAAREDLTALFFGIDGILIRILKE